jgi:hypothetical protein
MAPKITPKPTPVSGRNNKKSKVNKKVGLNKTTVNTTIHKKKKENKPKKDNSSGLDEKGNPLPRDDPKGGGDPVCPSGYKIDYDFDPFNDPINPPFRCISALKDPDDGPTSNIMNKLNNSANNIIDLASVIAPAAGGGARTMRRRRYHGKRRDKRKLTARRHKK